MDQQNVCCCGKIRTTSDYESNILNVQQLVENINERQLNEIPVYENEVRLTKDDIYKDLRIGGYDYGLFFRGLQTLRTKNFSTFEGTVEWDGNWITFTDSLLQSMAAGLPLRRMMVPVMIKSLKCDPRVLYEAVAERKLIDETNREFNADKTFNDLIGQQKENPFETESDFMAIDNKNLFEGVIGSRFQIYKSILPFYANLTTRMIVTHGLEVEDLLALPIPRKSNVQDLKLEFYQFVAVTLTEAGHYWASGLPPDLPMLPGDAPTDDPAVEGVTPSVAAGPSFEPVLIESILHRFTEDPRLAKLIFGYSQVRLLHAALHGVAGKRFVLLAGLSGTGKTSLARAYAQAYCDALGLSVARHYAQIAVWPDWTDPTGLLGFINPLREPPTFRETPALNLLLEADRNPTQPYFLCLDEMNLARVEHYFAPFLSAMEGQGGRLAIHPADEVIDRVPPSIAWPANLFIIGTVNMDETTYPFSDKVLDRAFTFEFWDADLDAWRQRVDPGTEPATLTAVFDVLKSLYAALLPARRHFGYRTCDEVLGFCTAASLDPTQALDAAVLAKVLPKIRGEAGGGLPEALVAAEKVCEEHSLKQSAAKLAQMRSTLAHVGVVRFWS